MFEKVREWWESRLRLAPSTDTNLVHTMKVATMDLEPSFPVDFPLGPYRSIEKRISVDLGEAHPDARREFAGGWNALRYRYLACANHDRDFTLSIQRPQTHQERTLQECDLFGFFVTGQSAVESLCYGLHAVGSVLNPTGFPVRTKRDLKKIDWRKTADLFTKFFPGEELAITLDHLKKSPDFEAWREQRNILTHRSTPGRVFNQGGPLHGVIGWSDIELNHETTPTRRQWLTETIREILAAADAFTNRHTSNMRASFGPSADEV